MKKYFTDFIASRRAQLTELNNALVESDSKEERASISATIRRVEEEIRNAESQLASLNENESRGAEGNGAAFNPVASYGAQTAQTTERNDDDLSTMEYRKAFKAYVQTGERSTLLKRADAENVSTDLGVLLPNTVVKEIIKGVEKVYGQLYSRVKKTNVKGGIQYPIGAFSATLHWDGTSGTDKEHGVSEEQKGGAVSGYIQFTYHIGEIRIAQSLLQTVVTVDAFEKEIINALVEAYVKAMDEAILEGDGVKQPEGILTEAAKGTSGRIPAGNIITFTAAEMEDWKSWQKKLFAVIPLSMRKLRPEFVMTANTWESNIMTLEDTYGRPVYRETYNPVTGDEEATFKGRPVVFVEEGGLKSFDDAAEGEYFGLYWVGSKAYSINSNMQFSYRRYFDERENQYVTKALVICDGKVLDPKYLYLLKKGAASTT